ncbi:MAG: hypothetical protein IPM35_32185 [Myxococcales bacterium]|nr:hypothetical protein [Myxococcales bacterium]
MAESPFRERRLSADEVRRVVRRATNLAHRRAPGDVAGEALTVAELEERLMALGISRDVVHSALEERVSAPITPGADGTARVEREIEIVGVLHPEDFEDLAELIGRVVRLPGRASAVGNKLTWTPSGVLTEPTLTVHSKDGVTRVRYVETLINSGQATIGFGVLAGFGGMVAGSMSGVAGVAIAKSLEISKATGGPAVLALSAVIGVVVAVGSFAGLRRAAARRAHSRTLFADEVLNQIGDAVGAAVAARAPKARIAASALTSPAHVAQDEGEQEPAPDSDVERRQQR